jgi:hypothetical protein
MDQYRAVAKVLKDLIQFGLIKEDDRGQARLHLDRLFAAGYDEGNHKQYAAFKKTTILYRSDGKVLGEWESAEEAARQNHCTVKSIYSSIRRTPKTRLSNYWKYKEEEA